MMKRSIMSVVLAASFLSSVTYATTDDGLGFQCSALDAGDISVCIDGYEYRPEANYFWCGDYQLNHLWVSPEIKDCLDNVNAWGDGHWGGLYDSILNDPKFKRYLDDDMAGVGGGSDALYWAQQASLTSSYEERQAKCDAEGRFWCHNPFNTEKAD